METINNNLENLILNLIKLYKNELFEEQMDETVKDITEHKPSEIKSQIKYMLELIEKCHNCDSTTIEEILTSIRMPSNAIELFKEKSHNNYEKNEAFKLAKFGKVNIYTYLQKVRFAESNSDKIEFYIKLILKYNNSSNNNFKEKAEMDLSINQFYNLFSEFQKIDNLINTLV